jgi:hypothetical protein
MEPYFEIVDDSGVINSPINTLDEAYAQLGELDNDSNFVQKGDLKIVEVYYIRA